MIRKISLLIILISTNSLYGQDVKAVLSGPASRDPGKAIFISAKGSVGVNYKFAVSPVITEFNIFKTVDNDYVIVSSIDDPGDYHFVLAVSDAKGQIALAVHKVSIKNPIPVPPPAVLSITPSNISLSQGTTQQFNLLSNGSPITATSWTTTQGNITNTGLFTAPSTTVPITAVITANNSVSTTVTVTAAPPPPPIPTDPFTKSLLEAYSTDLTTGSTVDHKIALMKIYKSASETTVWDKSLTEPKQVYDAMRVVAEKMQLTGKLPTLRKRISELEKDELKLTVGMKLDDALRTKIETFFKKVVNALNSVQLGTEEKRPITEGIKNA